MSAQRSPPSVTTRSTILRSTWLIPVNTVTKISTATRMKDNAIFDARPMPSQMTNSGARITRGTALSKVITGSSSSAINGTSGDPKRETAKRRGEGCLKMRPDAAVGEQIDQRGADLARAWQKKRIEHAGASRRLPQRQQQQQGGSAAGPGKACGANHHAASARRSTSRDRSVQIVS